ncbi:P-loop NTPase fold protein [Streptomyces gilvosporeus]|uniref:P-loop NTPase fold protein n=1 Tax=Streptomyces gilvosporeus TaxID=553510 RepID=UPI0019395F33|nr:P-loop NTPase fold protein [Streptomyces gilvosporeus]
MATSLSAPPPDATAPPARGPFALLNDEPVAEPGADLLGTGRAARQLAGLLVASRDSTPFTLAVDAGWGMGKSSLMRLVDAELSGHPEVHTVWYNAWTSTGADALEGLIKSVLMRLDRRVLRRGVQRVTERRALIRAVRAVTTVAAGPLGVAGLVDELWRSLSVNSQARNAMGAAIGDLVREWSETAAFRPRRLLVVFIDDLDRCSEETVLAVCEALKVYLDVPGLAFVVGCDRSALGPSGLLRDLSPAASAFMEKIFQTSYRVPAADTQGVKDYIRWCARTAGVAPLLDDALVDLLAQRSDRNPRRIKRLVNGFVLEATLNPVWRDFGPGAVIRTLLLQYFYPDFYRMMTGPSGTVDGDVVAEFRTYREVRRTLLAPAGAAPSAEELATVRDFLAPYDMPVPEPLGASGAAILATLERQLPSEFPDLVVNPAFTSLIDELTARPDADRLLVRLREGPPNSGGASSQLSREWEPLWQVLEGTRPDGSGPPLAWSVAEPPWGYGQAAGPEPVPQQQMSLPQQPAPAGQAPWPAPQQQATYPAPAPYPVPGPHLAPSFDVLWVDDQPERKAVVREVLESLGVQVVRQVPDSEAALAAVRLRTPDLIISDISRGRRHAEGFAMVERLQDDGRYDGPVVFFTIRRSAGREERAATLGASLTNNAQELRELVLAAGRERMADPAATANTAAVAVAAMNAARPRARVQEQQGAGPDLRGLVVLWLDDHVDNLFWPVAELRRERATVHLANTEQEALDVLAAHQVDLLVSDITRNGDVEAGFTFAKKLRDEERYLGALGFLTSEVTHGRKERAREVGALGVTLDPGTVRRWAEKMARGRRQGADRPAD